ncbi:MAG: phosphoribosylaminoimidazolesuccinocarboxamide synthase [Gemmatimonadota bacterium]|jgi:phosphoribosylaminoimidazole-succinocarboxamide synthase
MSDAPLLRSDLDLPLLHRGKVRDVYEVDDDTLLMVASDRVSAFDVVMSRPVPRKGEVLTLITAWWLSRLGGRVQHHLLAVDPEVIVARHPELAPSRDAWSRRAMLVRRTTPVLVECVVRGYISGSAWKEYRQMGTLAGEPLPEGLRESDRLDPPIFSPATKAERGEHDENITFDRMAEILGSELATRLRNLALEIYRFGRDQAEKADIILADTKFEFGHDASGRLLLIDEVMTPDSSRFWPKEHYAVGRGQPSLDKQPIRDWLDALEDWDKTPPPPELPDAVVDAASSRYQDVFRRLTGVSLDDYELPRFAQEEG